VKANALRTWLIVLITALLSLALGAGAVAVVYQARVIPGMKAAMQPAGGSGGGPPAGPPAASVRVAAVKRQPLQARFEVVGRLEALQRTTVAAEVSGRLLSVPIDEGDRVVADQTPLAKIDDVWARLDLAAAEADVASARAMLDQSERDLSYLEDLREANSAKPKEVADARAEVKSNQAKLDSAVARRERAKERVQRLTVYPPFDGMVVEKRAEAGQWVTEGTAVATIISRGQIDAVLDVPEKHISALETGTQVTVDVEPYGQTVTGKIVAIHPSGDNPARTFPVEVRLNDQIEVKRSGQNDDEPRTVRLRPGMSVTGYLPLDKQSPRLVVPHAAVAFGPRGAAVWLANDKTSSGEPVSGSNDKAPPQTNAKPTARRIDVEVLFSADDGYAVRPITGPATPTLAADDQVVIEGWERLMPGQPLQIVDTPGPNLAKPGQDDERSDAEPTRASRNGESTG
jgi:RND family efflux transporter MFP subunit